MDFKETLTCVLDLVEEKTKDKLTIQELSTRCYISSSYLQRLFKLSTGQALMDYVRGRKLAHSLQELLNTNLRILDVAQEYGFAHEQTYVRAFRLEYGCTPGEARKTKQILPIRERISPNDLHPVGEGLLYGPEIVMVPSFSVVGKPYVFDSFDRIKDALKPNQIGNEYYAELRCLPGIPHPNMYIGLCTLLDSKNNTIEYMPSLEVNRQAKVPAGLVGRNLPAGLCARFRYVGQHPSEEISMVTANETYKAIDTFFEKQTRYVRCENYWFEKIDTALYDGRYCQMEWFSPVADTLAVKDGK